MYHNTRGLHLPIGDLLLSKSPGLSGALVLYNRGDKNRHNCYACHTGGKKRGKAGLERNTR